MSESIEKIILRYSDRGLTKIQRYVSDNCCDKAAIEILTWDKGTVFLTTGFYVKGYAETDGPVGTVALSLALEKIGFQPIILTDKYCEGFFELENIETIYLDESTEDATLRNLVEKYNPKGFISIERCGKNRMGQYANMLGNSITEYTAPIDNLFDLYQGIIPTVGVGDGGNEIGMGKISGPIRRELTIEPCVVPTDILVIATVSNWGAYGIITALANKVGMQLLPQYDWVEEYIRKTVQIGSVDGVTHERQISVDGKNMIVEEEIISALKNLERRGEII